MKDRLINEYFEWLLNHTKDKRHIKYRKLLALLHNINFRYSIPLDSNREEDGLSLRYRFSCMSKYRKINVLKYLDKPCSVLEMMIALAIRCEESIMDDPDIGNRTAQWFWLMITNLDLEYMDDNHFDKSIAIEKIDIFLNREYKRNGEGGLFIVDNARRDLRNVEIWYQMCWYLDGLI